MKLIFAKLVAIYFFPHHFCQRKSLAFSEASRAGAPPPAEPPLGRCPGDRSGASHEIRYLESLRRFGLEVGLVWRSVWFGFRLVWF